MGSETRVRRGWLAVAIAGVIVFAPGHERLSGTAQAPPASSDLAARMLAPTTGEAASADAFALSLKRNQPANKLPRSVSLLVVLGPFVGLGLTPTRAGRIRLGDRLLVINLRLDRAAPRAPPLLSIS